LTETRNLAELTPKRSNHPLKPTKNPAVPVVDFCMCFLALCGLFNVAVGVAAFAFNLNLDMFGVAVTTTAQKLEWIGIYFVLSAVGFIYMLWRYEWRYRLSTMVQLAVLWCVFLVVTPMIATARGFLSTFLMGGISLFVVIYCLSWAGRTKRDRRRDNERK